MTNTAMEQTPQQEGRASLMTRPFIGLMLADLAYFTAGGITVFALPIYATGPVGTGKDGAGLAVGAFAVSALLLRPVAGRFADAHGRRLLMAGGAVLAALAIAGTAYASSLAALVALRVVLGVAEAAFFVASFAALADLAPRERLGEALSYGSLGLYGGLALGPLLGQLLIAEIGFAAAWFAGGALAAISALLTVGLVGETRTPQPGDPVAHLIHRPGLPVAAGFLAAMVAAGGFLAFVALYATGLGLAKPSLPLSLYGGVVVVGRLTFARVADRFPPLVLGTGALGLLSLGLVVIAVSREPVGLFTGVVLLALGVTISTPAFFSAIFSTARPAERGAASATASACVDLGLGVGPMLLGLVAESAGLPLAFWMAAAIAALGAVWTVRLVATSRRRVHPG